MNGLFTTNSSQVASADVLGRRNLVLKKRTNSYCPVVRLTHRALLVLFALVLTSRTVAAGDWPENYIVHEQSESPDGRYGVIILSKQAAIDRDETEGNTTYLVNLQTRKTLGEVRGTDYFEHQNHRGLEVFWAPQSSVCMVENDGRYGADSISVLEINEASFTQTEIGDRIQKSLDGAMKKQAHDPEMAGDVSPYFRFGTDRKVRVRALSQNNPKQFEDVKTYYALFQGTFDVATKKWTVMDTRSINAEQDDALATAYGDLEQDLEHTTFQNEEDKAESLDQTMNKVYRAAQFILPPARFAAVKREQIDWLKKRNAAPSTDEKCKLMEARIKALQELVW